jgi:hypothetical protein
VAPLFHYVEKGGENDAAVACSVTTTLFFLPQPAGNEILWQKFQKFLQNFVNFAK